MWQLRERGTHFVVCPLVFVTPLPPVTRFRVPLPAPPESVSCRVFSPRLLLPGPDVHAFMISSYREAPFATSKLAISHNTISRMGSKETGPPLWLLLSYFDFHRKFLRLECLEQRRCRPGCRAGRWGAGRFWKARQAPAAPQPRAATTKEGPGRVFLPRFRLTLFADHPTRPPQP